MTSSRISSPCRPAGREWRRRRRTAGAVRVGIFLIYAVAFAWPGLASPGGEPQRGWSVPTRWHTITVRDGLPHDSVRAIHVSGPRVWVGTDGGLALYENGEWKAWTRADGLPAGAISAIDVDPDTLEVWLGTWGDGLVRFSAGRFDRFEQFNSGLAGNLVFDVAVTGGRVWAATNGGVSSFRPSTDTWGLYFPRRAHSPELAVTGLMTHGDALYAKLSQGDHMRFDPAPQRWSPTASSLGLSVRVGFGLPIAVRRTLLHGPAARHHGLVWVGSDRGLFVFTDPVTNHWLQLLSDGSLVVHRANEPIESRRLPSSFPGDRIRCLAFDGHDLWVGTPSGLSRGESPRTLSAIQLSDGRDAALPGRPQQQLPHHEPPAEPPAVDRPLQSAVGIAIYGPRARVIALPGERSGVPNEPGRPDPLAVGVAIEHENDRRSKRGSPPIDLITLRKGYGRYGWGLPEDDIVAFSNDPRVAGMVGHLTEEQLIVRAVVQRSEVPWVNVAPALTRGRPSADESPWIFECHGSEPGRHRMLFNHLVDHLGLVKIALLATAGPETATRLAWWSSHAERRAHSAVAELEWPGDPEGPTKVLAELRAMKPDVVVTWADPRTTADILLALRTAGLRQRVVVSSDCVTDEFVGRVGVATDQVIALDPRMPDPISRVVNPAGAGDRSWSFVKRYAARNVTARGHREPDLLAHRSFSATEHLVRAIEAAGPDREAVRRMLNLMSRSANGEEHYEESYEPAPTRVAKIVAGRWVYQTLPSSLVGPKK